MNSRPRPRTQSGLWNADHGAGKGDKDRTANPSTYAANLAEVSFPHSNEGFTREGNKLVKRYGSARKAEAHCGGIIIH